mmetsp:Transcript_20219/g.65134  ORF Transcript_20219/g.65134 Transcript_20219/m.65134 type:complete len:320 (+) Transcript_20219:1144-2103(+)
MEAGVCSWIFRQNGLISSGLLRFSGFAYKCTLTHIFFVQRGVGRFLFSSFLGASSLVREIGEGIREGKAGTHKERGREGGMTKERGELDGDPHDDVVIVGDGMGGLGVEEGRVVAVVVCLVLVGRDGGRVVVLVFLRGLFVGSSRRPASDGLVVGGDSEGRRQEEGEAGGDQDREEGVVVAGVFFFVVAVVFLGGQRFDDLGVSAVGAVGAEVARRCDDGPGAVAADAVAGEGARIVAGLEAPGDHRRDGDQVVAPGGGLRHGRSRPRRRRTRHNAFHRQPRFTSGEECLVVDPALPFREGHHQGVPADRRVVGGAPGV